MGRCYHLSKTVTEDLANEIIKELTERGDVKHARISADGRYLHVDTIDGEIFRGNVFSSKYLQPYCKLRAVLCEI